MTKTKEYTKLDELAEYKGKWKNLLFDKKGKSYKGELDYDSKEQARKQMEVVLAEISKPLPNGAGWYIQVMNGIVLESDYAWSMQIPVSDK